MYAGLRILIALVLFFLGFIPFSVPYVSFLLFLASYLIVGTEVIWKALRNIFKGDFLDENFLMTLATIGAFLLKLYPEAVAVMLFYQIGEFFQDYAVDKSKKSIAALMDLRPDVAYVVESKRIVKTKPEDVKVGDIILVKVGEKVPLDGIVIEGESFLDTSSLTGEAVYKRVSLNDSILSGSINKEAPLKIKVTKIYSESTVQKILDLVENATDHKTKSENFVSSFAHIYTPIVVIASLVLATIPPLILKESIDPWIYRALSFLVVSCPCALVLSIPLSFFSGIGACSKMGILVKGSNYLERLEKMKTLAFDKTGTLTKGVFAVQEIRSKKYSEEELLRYASYAENYSIHPIAVSLKNDFHEEIDESKISNVKEIAGEGAEATVFGKKVLVGSRDFLEKHDISCPKQNGAGTLLYVAIAKEFAGTILLADQVKDDTSQLIKLLKQEGIQKTILLTGDQKDIANDVKKRLGIDEVHASLLPHDKVKCLKELMSKKDKDTFLGYVGDGINDAPVLASADLGIAMGGLGSDAAIDASDIVLLTDEPTKLISAIRIAKKTMKIVRENITFALLVKFVILALSAFGITNLWVSIFGDVGVTVLAVFNSLRILNVRKINS